MNFDYFAKGYDFQWLQRPLNLPRLEAFAAASKLHLVLVRVAVVTISLEYPDTWPYYFAKLFYLPLISSTFLQFDHPQLKSSSSFEKSQIRKKSYLDISHLLFYLIQNSLWFSVFVRIVSKKTLYKFSGATICQRGRRRSREENFFRTLLNRKPETGDFNDRKRATHKTHSGGHFLFILGQTNIPTQRNT